MSFSEVYQKDLMYLMTDKVWTFHIKEWSLGHYCMSNVPDHPIPFNEEIRAEIGNGALFRRRFSLVILER